MLKIKSTQNVSFAQKKSNQKNSKLSFGMNPISKTKDKITSNLAPLASDVYQISNSIANSNTQQSSTQQNLNNDVGYIELVDVITASQQNDSLNAISQNPLQNSPSLPQDDSEYDDEFYEKDKAADEFYNKYINKGVKILTCIPLLGAVGAFILLGSTRNDKLDELYNIPKYTPVYHKSSCSFNTLMAITFLHIIPLGSIIATPLAIMSIKKITKELNEDTKKAYHEAYKKEQEQVKKETPEQTRLRHAKLREEYQEAQRKAAETRRSSRNRSSQRARKTYKVPSLGPNNCGHGGR